MEKRERERQKKHLAYVHVGFLQLFVGVYCTIPHLAMIVAKLTRFGGWIFKAAASIEIITAVARRS